MSNAPMKIYFWQEVVVFLEIMYNSDPQNETWMNAKNKLTISMKDWDDGPKLKNIDPILKSMAPIAKENPAKERVNIPIIDLEDSGPTIIDETPNRTSKLPINAPM